MKKICFSMTVPSALRAFMADHIRSLAEHYDVTVFCNFSEDPCDGLFDDAVKLVHIPFERNIRPLKDLGCLFHLSFKLREGGYSSIHSLMPKTGLLAMVAGWMAGVPIRLHTFTGQVWVTQTGLFRLLLKSMDRFIACFSTGVYADSPSQRDFLLAKKVIKSGTVLCDGSITGVDCNRFKPDSDARKSVRAQYGIPPESVIFGFVGRLNKDKGVYDLAEAFSILQLDQAAHLLLVGPDEDDIADVVREKFPNVWKRLHFAGYSTEPERFVAAFDVFCLPSYREGFGSSVIEAATCSVPALVSRIYGLTDAVLEGETGLFHEAGDIDGIASGLERYGMDRQLRAKHGRAARKRAVDLFPIDRLTAAMRAEYARLLGGEG